MYCCTLCVWPGHWCCVTVSCLCRFICFVLRLVGCMLFSSRSKMHFHIDTHEQAANTQLIASVCESSMRLYLLSFLIREECVYNIFDAISQLHTHLHRKASNRTQSVAVVSVVYYVSIPHKHTITFARTMNIDTLLWVAWEQNTAADIVDLLSTPPKASSTHFIVCICPMCRLVVSCAHRHTL